MKGKWTNRMTVLAVCAVPYVFLGMYGDAVYGSTLGYLPMLAWMGWESRMAVRPRSLFTLLGGNLLSFLSSFLFMSLFQTPRWGWYFKLLTAFGFLVAASLLILLAQGFLIYLFQARNPNTIKHKEEHL